MAKEFLSKIMAKKKEKRTAKEREKAFVENGSKLLEKLIATCNGKSTPIRNFSYEELKRATNSFHHSSLVANHDSIKFNLHSSQGGNYILDAKRYKGSLEGRNVLIETSKGDRNDISIDYAINEIAISAMMSVHGNVLRLIGCCLETRVPYAVFEFPANGSLYDRIHHVVSDRQYEPMAWSSRLRIAREAARAISFLHTSFSRPIIHRDISLENIFLDQHDVAKLSSFGYSISIPQGETYVKTDTACGTVGYISQEHLSTGRITEKADVFSFGIFLFQLLTGQKAFDLARLVEDGDVMLIDAIKTKYAEGHGTNEIVDPTILQGEGGAFIEHQLQAVMDLAFTCSEEKPEMRPTMVDVTKQLMRIEKSVP